METHTLSLAAPLSLAAQCANQIAQKGTDAGYQYWLKKNKKFIDALLLEHDFNKEPWSSSVLSYGGSEENKMLYEYLESQEFDVEIHNIGNISNYVTARLPFHMLKK